MSQPKILKDIVTRFHSAHKLYSDALFSWEKSQKKYELAKRAWGFRVAKFHTTIESFNKELEEFSLEIPPSAF